MAIHKDLKYASVDELFLDSHNPRLGRHVTERNLSQDKLLELMDDFTLDELAVSILESGYWPQEALIVVKEPVGREKDCLVVVEGNRRLSALKLLTRYVKGQKLPRSWKDDIVADVPVSDIKSKISKIPYLLADSREDVRAYLGFRHVTGIKQWNPTEKAEFITAMIESGMSYKEVMRKIGSNTNSVRQNYISYRILAQMEDVEDIDLSSVENKFSVLYLSLRTLGVRTFLSIDIKADPETAKVPVPPDKLSNLIDYASWVFGTKSKPAVFTDSRLVDKFGKILESVPAVAYLRSASEPRFENAYRLAGGSEADVATSLEEAAFSIEQALGVIHLVSKSPNVIKAAERVAKDFIQLANHIPSIQTFVIKELK